MKKSIHLIDLIKTVHEYFVLFYVKTGFDTAENEPLKVWMRCYSFIRLLNRHRKCAGGAATSQHVVGPLICHATFCALRPRVHVHRLTFSYQEVLNRFWASRSYAKRSRRIQTAFVRKMRCEIPPSSFAALEEPPQLKHSGCNSCESKR